MVDTILLSFSGYGSVVMVFCEQQWMDKHIKVTKGINIDKPS